VSPVLTVEGRSVAVSKLDKVLWPSAAYTKGAMLDYYIERLRLSCPTSWDGR
jgi:DNA primase